MTSAPVPGGVPDAYARYIRAIWPAELDDFAAAEIAGRWEHQTGPREREFWRSLDSAPVMTPAVARPPHGSVLVLAVGTGTPEESVRSLEETFAAAAEGVTVVTVRGIEALRIWEPAAGDVP